MEDFYLFQAESSKIFACGGEISYFRLFPSCSPYFRVSSRTKSPYFRVFFCCWVSSRTKSPYFRVSSRTIFSLYFRVSSRTKIMRIRTKLGNIACGGLEDNNIIAPVLQMSCSTWTLVSVRLRIVEVHSHVNQNRKLGNTSGSALSQFEHRSKTHWEHACAHIYM